MNGGLICLIVVLVVLFFLFAVNNNSKDSYFASSSLNPGWGSSQNSGYYDNIAGYSYQNYPTSTRAEVNYTSDVLSSCYGPGDVNCLGKQHLRTFREGMDYKDVGDWVCGPQCKVTNPDRYYNCLNQVYTDWKFP